jgi:hypothetical protein
MKKSLKNPFISWLLVGTCRKYEKKFKKSFYILATCWNLSQKVFGNLNLFFRMWQITAIFPYRNPLDEWKS